MTFKPAVWYPISFILSALNLVAIGVFAGEPLHAVAHGGLALAFGLWAQRLRQQRPRESQGERDPRLEVLEAEVSNLRRELGHTQEGLDFTERLLAQRPEAQRVSLQRDAPRQPDIVTSSDAATKKAPTEPRHYDAGDE
jgi:hypothetical protein